MKKNPDNLWEAGSVFNPNFLYYTAVKGVGREKEVRIALATSKDFKRWNKHGIVGPATGSKAALLFPEKIGGEYIMFYTWMPDRSLSSIMQGRFSSLKDVLNPPKGMIANTLDSYEENVVFEPPVKTYRGLEAGAVPIKTKDGWLLIY